jgi:transposase
MFPPDPADHLHNQHPRSPARIPQQAACSTYANGHRQGSGHVTAAITSPWSNGQTEGQITKLKLVKRQMYGGGKIDLLQARVIGAE